jgi:hypothetical protein
MRDPVTVIASAAVAVSTASSSAACGAISVVWAKVSAGIPKQASDALHMSIFETLKLRILFTPKEFSICAPNFI